MDDLIFYEDICGLEGALISVKKSMEYSKSAKCLPISIRIYPLTYWCPHSAPGA